jgi:hypothetical protein
LFKHLYHRIGYDSLAGGCVINHLHCEVIFIDDFGLEHLPIEKSNKEAVLTTKFQHKEKKDDDEVCMLDDKFEVTLYTTDYYINSWKVEVKEIQHEHKLLESNFNLSIATMVNFILTKLIDQSIPHNILITDKGQSFFIIPRKYIDSSNTKLEYNTCWNDLVGLTTFKTSLPETDISINLKENVSLDDTDFKQLTLALKESFSDLYLIN